MPDPAFTSPPSSRWLSAPARRAWRWLLLLLMLAVCVLAFDPHPPPELDTGWDKRNHLLAFATLALVAEFGYWHRPRRHWGVLLGLLAFGGAIELVQAQIPARSGDWADLLADALGIVLGLLLARAVARGFSRPARPVP